MNISSFNVLNKGSFRGDASITLEIMINLVPNNFEISSISSSVCYVNFPPERVPILVLIFLACKLSCTGGWSYCQIITPWSRATYTAGRLFTGATLYHNIVENPQTILSS